MAEGALALGVLGALPRDPITISPSLNGNDSRTQVNIICCSRGASASNYLDNRRIIYQKGQLDETKLDGKLCKLFKEFCCCCCRSDDSEKNRQAIEAMEIYFIQQYGETAAKTAPLYVGIDLKEKKEAGIHLSVREFKELNQAAQEVNLYQPELVRIARALKFFASQQHSELSECTDSPTHEATECASLTVTHSDGRKEKFKKKKVKTCLQELPTSKVLPELEIREIIAQVKKELKVRELSEASTGTIRGIIGQKLKDRGYEIEPPIPLRDSMIESFQEIGFTPELYAQMLKAVKEGEQSKAIDSSSDES